MYKKREKGAGDGGAARKNSLGNAWESDQKNISSSSFAFHIAGSIFLSLAA